MDMYMDVDVALTEVPVNLMPLMDATDFKTIEDAVAYNAAGLALVWHFITTAGVYNNGVAVTPTTAGAHDWTDHGTHGIYTIEIPASGGTINNDTEGFGWFTGVADGVLPWRGPVICFRAARLNDLLIDDGNLLDDLFRLSLRSDAAIKADAVATLNIINANRGSGAGGYDNTVAPTVAVTSTGLDAPLDLANGVETGITLRNSLRLCTAAAAGKLSGAASTTVTIRNAAADNKNRIVATVDADGNRSAVTLDLT